MIRFRVLGCLSLLCGPLLVSGLAQQSADFTGNWVLTIWGRNFLEVTIRQTPKGGTHFTGSVAQPQSFSVSSGGNGFSGIKGPVVRDPIVRSAIKGNCLSFKTGYPTDKSDADDYQLCIKEQNQGMLKALMSGFVLDLEPWPVTRQKGPSRIATDWDATRTYYPDDNAVSSAEMLQISDEDQKPRQGDAAAMLEVYDERQKERQPGPAKIDWNVVSKADAVRREATAKLLADGKLHTGEDFERAAWIFHHGTTPDDFLLAHTLAMVALARGDRRAVHIAALSLDRYLHSVHQPQIYGTQFSNPPTTQEPYNRSLVSDALRRLLGVPSQAAQEEQRKNLDAERPQP